MNHEDYIWQAIDLAVAARAKGNGPFGALLVYQGAVVLTAENTIHSEGDLTNHAEMNLVRAAVRQYDLAFLRQCTLYTSTEPCAMCAGAIFWAGIGQVVFGCSVQRLKQIYPSNTLDLPCSQVFALGDHPVSVVGPVLEDEAAKVHQP